MAFTLKSRDKSIPYGFKYLQPETNWTAPKNSSFSRVVNGLISHRRARPDLVAAKGWSLNYDTVADEVDAFNARVCAQHGWNDYINDGATDHGPPPKSQALLQSEKSVIAAAAGKAKKIWGGIRTLNEWIDSGTPPVSQDKSNARAAVCVACPKNGKGDLTSLFTKPASEVIAEQLGKLKAMKFATKFDDKLGVCEVCSCPLKLKAHTPIIYIKNNMSGEVLAELRQVRGVG